MRQFFATAHTDLVGFSASFLCAIHCGMLPFILTISALNGLHWMTNPWIELSFIIASMGIAIFALGRNFRKHKHILRAIQVVIAGFVFIVGSHFLPIGHTVTHILAAAGGITVAAGHILNWQLAKRSTCCKEGH